MIMRPFVICSGSEIVGRWPVASGIGGHLPVDSALQFVRASLEEVSSSVATGCNSWLALVPPVFGSLSACGYKASESGKKTNKSLVVNGSPLCVGVLWLFHRFLVYRQALSARCQS